MLTLNRQTFIQHTYIIILFLLIGFTPSVIITNQFDMYQKVFILITVVGSAIFLGIDKRLMYAPVVFLSTAILSYILKNQNSYSVELDVFLSSLISMSIMYLLWAVNTKKIHIELTKAMAYLPFFAIFIFFVSQPVTGMPLIRHEYTGAIRLAGLLHPAHLAMLLYFSLAFFVYRSLLENKPYYIHIAVLAVLLLLTGTRGASLASLIILLPMTTFLNRKYTFYLATLLSIPLVILLTAVINNILSRNAAQMNDDTINTSGRATAWEFFINSTDGWNLFGNGLGSVISVTTGITDFNLYAFKTPHNEYIRFYVDLGLVGATFLFANLIYMMRQTLTNAIVYRRFFIPIFFISFFMYSFIDNTLSTPQSVIPLVIFMKYIFYQTYYNDKALV